MLRQRGVVLALNFSEFSFAQWFVAELLMMLLVFFCGFLVLDRTVIHVPFGHRLSVLLNEARSDREFVKGSPTSESAIGKTGAQQTGDLSSDLTRSGVKPRLDLGHAA
jgi:hypothetical protein